VADLVKDIGFEYAMRSGSTLAVSDIRHPGRQAEILAKAQGEVETSTARLPPRFADRAGAQRARHRDLAADHQYTGEAVRKNMDPNGNLFTMANSGATKGGFGTISQLAGMRGLMADPAGRIIRLPIQSNFREGLTALEYFISTHGARKGLADTALRTADAGYLTRRLVDVAQDVIINEIDCGTHDGTGSARRRRGGPVDGHAPVRAFAGDPGHRPDYGRSAGRARRHPRSRARAPHHVEAGVDEVNVRSPLTCELIHGICAKCYGMDLGRGRMVELGSAVGIVAAQSIGEPGTQLTLRTFHTGGVAAGGDITTGLPRVEELFEARRMPKGEAVISRISGVANIIQSDRTANSARCASITARS
jgi:DNA-directed RNA polymerase subunit beta'